MGVVPGSPTPADRHTEGPDRAGARFRIVVTLRAGWVSAFSLPVPAPAIAVFVIWHRAAMPTPVHR
ncbi:MAG: hypothetical protein JWS10_523 [Cypionkella sp.]|nr:hypothetical protein [Cypionkella sp.]